MGYWHQAPRFGTARSSRATPTASARLAISSTHIMTPTTSWRALRLRKFPKVTPRPGLRPRTVDLIATAQNGTKPTTLTSRPVTMALPLGATGMQPKAARARAQTRTTGGSGAGEEPTTRKCTSTSKGAATTTTRSACRRSTACVAMPARGGTRRWRSTFCHTTTTPRSTATTILTILI